MPILQGPENFITKDLTEAEKNLGVDLKLTKEGDLEVSNLGDVKIIGGGANAAQAVMLKLFTEPGGVLYHPEIGTDLNVGEKVRNAFDIKLQVIKSLNQDPRFEDIQVKVTVDGDTIFIDLSVRIADTGLEVPLQFAVLN